MRTFKQNLRNWLNLCNMAIFAHTKGEDYQKYAISKGNLQVNDISQWNLLKNFIDSILSRKVVITELDLKKLQEKK